MRPATTIAIILLLTAILTAAMLQFLLAAR
jgi:hypothetical protein